ncbi:hypothetical protein DL96DRAFT_1812897 [Flagelloscypha sp. PMI_526]|nr:hypothetical protein DL96DRAFT_1812897 [Flagelloscypha sp. PMI_526]
MGNWHIYCMLSGMSAGYVSGIVPESESTIKELAAGLATRILNVQHSDVLPPQDEMETILVDALTRLAARDVPDSMDTWCKEVAVVTDFEGGGNPDAEFTNSASSGAIDYIGNSTIFHEKLRFCADFQEDYMYWLRYLSNGTTWINEVTSIARRRRGDNLFVDRRCWYYLNSWLSIPPRSDILDNRGLEWDILHVVRDSLQSKTWPEMCIHPGLDYGPLIQGYWPQYRDFIIDGDIEGGLESCLETAPHVRQALSDGLREDDLGPALLRDFQTWVFERPDRWPSRSDSDITPTFRTFPASSSPTLASLPFEVSLEIFSDISLPDLANLSSTSKSLRQLMNQPSLFSEILRGMVNHGSLSWIRPCPEVMGESEYAHQTLVTWMDNVKCRNPLNNIDFPFVSFVYACFVTSHSMKSRYRLWKIVKQLEPSWVAYRNAENNCQNS